MEFRGKPDNLKKKPKTNIKTQLKCCLLQRASGGHGGTLTLLPLNSPPLENFWSLLVSRSVLVCCASLTFPVGQDLGVLVPPINTRGAESAALHHTSPNLVHFSSVLHIFLLLFSPNALGAPIKCCVLFFVLFCFFACVRVCVWPQCEHQGAGLSRPF